jgi:hypothetical protein
MGNMCPKKEKSGSEAPLMSKKSNLDRSSNQRKSVDEESKFSYYNSHGEEGKNDIDTKKLQFKDFKIVRVRELNLSSNFNFFESVCVFTP